MRITQCNQTIISNKASYCNLIKANFNLLVHSIFAISSERKRTNAFMK